jgi:hypothetical protein
LLNGERIAPLKNGFTFYTYSTPGLPGENWADTGIRDRFFKSYEEARTAVLDIREALADDPDDDTWRPLRIEKIDMLPVTENSILALLNDGVGALVENYEIVEVIE